MTRRFAYDPAREPAAPVLPLGVAPPLSNATVLLRGLVDSGADCTVVPVAIVRQLELPVAGRVEVAGVMGAARRMPVYAAAAELPGLRTIVRILAMGTEAIIGRDLLNRMVARLDGPAAAVSVERPPRRRR